MGLSARPVPGVTLVPVRFVLDVQALGREGRSQLFSDEIAFAHIQFCIWD